MELLESELHLQLPQLFFGRLELLGEVAVGAGLGAVASEEGVAEQAACRRTGQSLRVGHPLKKKIHSG